MFMNKKYLTRLPQIGTILLLNRTTYPITAILIVKVVNVNYKTNEIRVSKIETCYTMWTSLCKLYTY